MLERRKRQRIEYKIKIMLRLALVLMLGLMRSGICQIHRASNKHDYQIKYDSNFTANYLMKQLNLVENSSSSDTFKFFGIKDEKLLVWAFTVIGTFFVGVCGIVPVLILPQLADDHAKLSKFSYKLVAIQCIEFIQFVVLCLVKSSTFNCLVSFAAGSLLGDVFIHLLPEAYSNNVFGEIRRRNLDFKFQVYHFFFKDHHQKTWMGIWLLFGLLTFLSIEILFPDDNDDDSAVVKSAKKSKAKKKENVQPKKFRLFEHIKVGPAMRNSK